MKRRPQPLPAEDGGGAAPTVDGGPLAQIFGWKTEKTDSATVRLRIFE